MKKTAMLVLAVLATLAVVPVRAQDNKPSTDSPAHEQLRTLRREMVEAVNKGDVDALLTHLDKDVVVTWMDGRVSHGPQGVREYIEQMTKGDNRKVTSYKTEAEVDELTHLYGDTGVATGHSTDKFVLTDGRDFTVNSRWTATLVRKDDQWKIAAFHASAGMFDNPVLDLAVKKTATWTGVGAGLGGLVVGFAIAWLLRGRKTAG